MAIGLVFAAGSVASAAMTMPNVFGDHMVVPRGTQMPVWGWENPGQTVEVSASWGAKVSATAGADGAWRAVISTPKAGGPFTLTVRGSENRTFTNVLSGDVWLCSGQSNMEKWVGPQPGQVAINNSAAEVAAANFPNIRLLKVARKRANTPQTTFEGTWNPTTPATIAQFSATGYFFGRELHQVLGIPIGLIDSSVGGTAVEEWMHTETLATFPFMTERLKQENTRTGTLYNAMIHPLKGFPVKGVIWYQGEANVGRPAEYLPLFKAFTEDWRKDFGADIPFYAVQIAPWSGYNAGDNPAQIRDAQFRAIDLRRVGVVPTLDITGDLNDIHPTNKLDVGTRLAKWALRFDYGRPVAFSGPLFDSAVVEPGAIRVRFRHADGLKAGDYLVRGFEIAGADGKFVSATALISGSEVVVFSSRVENPKWVRYAWSEDLRANLMNGAGLPAPTFRTGP